MGPFDRRTVVAGLAAGVARTLVWPAAAQTAVEPPVNRFGFEDVL